MNTRLIPALKKALVHAATDKSGRLTNCVMFYPAAHEYFREGAIVATDGHRMYVHEGLCGVKVAALPDDVRLHTVPALSRSSVEDIIAKARTRKIDPYADKFLDLTGPKDSPGVFRFGDQTLRVPLSPREFPRTWNVIPAPNDVRLFFRIQAQMLAQIIEQVFDTGVARAVEATGLSRRRFLNRGHVNIVFHYDPETGLSLLPKVGLNVMDFPRTDQRELLKRLKLDGNYWTAYEEFTPWNVPGAPLGQTFDAIGFNPRYLLDALAGVAGMTEVSFVNGHEPAKIVLPGGDYVVIMPVRL